MPLLFAGVPLSNKALYHRMRFACGDPAAWMTLPDNSSLLLVRDIEVSRARQAARADWVASPEDFEPAGGLSGDRETAVAQATAEALRRQGVAEVTADRTLPLLFADVLREAGIAVTCDRLLGVTERRAKDEAELAALAAAQRDTIAAVEHGVQMITTADVADGVLTVGGEPLTSERVRAAIELFLINRGLRSDSGMIVAGGPHAGDCHERGSGVLRPSEPVIIDVFPRHAESLYVGDCTRTCCPGEPPAWYTRARAAVLEAKAAAEAALAPGVTGAAVHAAAVAVLEQHGFRYGQSRQGNEFTQPHGTGHGVGLDLHEPPLLDPKGGPLVEGDVVTIEPGLYANGLGGVREEDMLTITSTGSRRLGG
jgi:Xaa-Pro aminopeptidase